jgi:hypothetical protein
VAVRTLAVVAVGLVLGIGAAALAIARDGEPDGVTQAAIATVTPSSAPSEARTPAEANRRVLTAAQTRRLVRYATALHACLTARGVDVAAPRKGPRAITIEAAKPVGLERLVAEMTPCAVPLGAPPGPSSLQAVDAQTIVLSVPKRCLLDPKTELAAPPQP